MSSRAAPRMRLAATSLERARGLLATRREDRLGEWLVLCPCRTVHTLFMRYAIDLAFIDARGTVLRVTRDVPPGVPWLGCASARAVLERPAGGLDEAWPEVGSHLVLGAAYDASSPEGSGLDSRGRR